MKFVNEFKDFASKGNIVDLAVGIVIGGAFGKIVSSIVADIIMPPLGLLIGGVNFTDLKFIIKAGAVDAAGKAIPAVTLNYGNFLQTLFDFLIIAFAMFLVVKAMMKLKKKQETAPAAPAAPTASEKLLEEIRDTLKEKK
ncbi:MAG: large-conductance mechanosensitive channel protein MscL [Bacteroidota bacterium]